MLARLSRLIYPALVRRDETRSETSLRHDVRAHAERLRLVEADRERLREELEAERVTVRIQQLEIDALVAVCRRDLERVRAETDVFTKGREP